MVIQKRIFDLLEAKSHDAVNLVDKVSEALGLSSYAAYRRMNGKVKLSLEECSQLCKVFGLDANELLGVAEADDFALFRYSKVDVTNSDGIEQLLKPLREAFSRCKFDAELFFAAQEIPLPHFLRTPELLYLPRYVWQYIVGREKMPFEEFYASLDIDNIKIINDKTYKYYLDIISTEIWNTHTVDATLYMIRHYAALGVFRSKQTVELLFKQILYILDNVEKMAETGCKGEDGTRFSLYLCDTIIDNHCLLIKNGEKQTVRYKVLTINNFISRDPELCEETEVWMQDLIAKSLPVSGVSEVERSRFFSSMRLKVENVLQEALQG